jgi:hypothetical protein
MIIQRIESQLQQQNADCGALTGNPQNLCRRCPKPCSKSSGIAFSVGYLSSANHKIRPSPWLLASISFARQHNKTGDFINRQGLPWACMPFFFRIHGKAIFNLIMLTPEARETWVAIYSREARTHQGTRRTFILGKYSFDFDCFSFGECYFVRPDCYLSAMQFSGKQ